MYAPHTRLGDYVSISKRREHFRDRWKSKEGLELNQVLLSAIGLGSAEAVRQVLQAFPENFLDDGYDLRGLHFVNFKLQSPENELFLAATLNYSRLREARFMHTAFESTFFNFVDSVRTNFEDCSFIRATFFCATFEDCVFKNCNFLERDTFSNCSFKNVRFENCFFETDIFTDCVFDERTEVTTIRQISHRFRYLKESVKKFDNSYLSSFYQDIHEAYETGHASTLAQRYMFMEKQAYTRYNTSPGFHRMTNFFLEYTNGYGTRPVRVLFTATTILAIFTAIFIAKFGAAGFLLSTGGFFTFGAETSLLDSAGIGYHVLYFFEAFLGVTNMSIFIVTLTNYWSLQR